MKELDNLAKLLIKDLTDKISSGEAKASDLNVGRQLLKDAGYEYIAQDLNQFNTLVKNLPFDQEELMTTFKKQG